MLDKKYFFKKYNINEDILKESNINWDELIEIYEDYSKYIESYQTQADLIANILRRHKNVHSVKSRVKDGEHLIEKVIRKTENRRKKYGKDFKFTVDNYKKEITDLVGIRVIHIFKEDWEEIHNFITKMWDVNEIVANIREGDNTKRFEELSIDVCSRLSGYRSVHYIIESYPTMEKITVEIQVRTIFEEGYGEIDHQLRYSLENIPEILEQNLMLLNRIAGSSDEMASLINLLSKSFNEIEERYNENIHESETKLEKIKNEILNSSHISNEEKSRLLRHM